MGVVFANRSLNGSHIRYTIFNNSYTISFNSWRHSNCQDKDLIVLSITTLKVIVENSIKYFYRIAKDIKTKHIEFNNHNYVEFKDAFIVSITPLCLSILSMTWHIHRLRNCRHRRCRG